MRVTIPTVIMLLAFGCLFLSGCSREYYRKQTDREVYGLLEKKTKGTPWSVGPGFTVEPDMRSKCCLEERELKELVNMAKNIENHYGRAMDIEWAIDKNLPFPENMFIVQARPETVWSQRKAKPVIGRKSGYQLLMEQAMKRIKVQ